MKRSSHGDTTMNKELLDYYGQPDEGNFIRLHAYDLQQLVKNANASFTMLTDLNDLSRALNQMGKERDYWRNMAEAYADEVRSFTRKTLFVEYERERQQRIHGTNND